MGLTHLSVKENNNEKCRYTFLITLSGMQFVGSFVYVYGALIVCVFWYG